MDKGLFLAPTKIDGVFRFDVTMFRSIAKFPWEQLYNLPDKKEASPKPTGVQFAGPPANALEEFER